MFYSCESFQNKSTRILRITQKKCNNLIRKEKINKIQNHISFPTAFPNKFYFTYVKTCDCWRNFQMRIRRYCYTSLIIFIKKCFLLYINFLMIFLKNTEWPRTILASLLLITNQFKKKNLTPTYVKTCNFSKI